MSASFSLRTSFIASALLVGLGLFAAGCAANNGQEDDGSTSEDFRTGNGFGHGPGGNGPPGHGGDHGGGPGGDHGGFHGPHHGGQGLGQHHFGGHFGQHGPETVTPPAGVYLASITAAGSGCPDGSWDVGISDDGQTFTLAFSAYEAQVASGQAVDMKDCTLDINLGSTGGLSFSVASFNYQGYILLDQDGMSAHQSASYFFEHENPHDQSRNDVGGPFDNSYLFTDDIGMFQRSWSPCGQNSTLHVRTGLVMRNNPQNSGDGYINASTVDGSLSVKWGLNWRQCNGGPGGQFGH
jgi:hypothetical protein